jgi:predicted sugar kinase
MKTDFEPFKVGTVHNPISYRLRNNHAVLENVVIQFPSRLNAMAIDPGQIADNRNLVYTSGEIVFCVNEYCQVSASLNDSSNLEISERSKRKSLIRHAYELMKQAINFKDGLTIDVDNQTELSHVGLGSSSRLMASVACAINEIYGNPIPREILIKYLAQNHGEEMDSDSGYIVPVQSIGGSAAAGLYEGGVMVVAGKNNVIKTANISQQYTVLLGIPKDFIPIDSKSALAKEIENLDGFRNCGKVKS